MFIGAGAPPPGWVGGAVCMLRYVLAIYPTCLPEFVFVGAVQVPAAHAAVDLQLQGRPLQEPGVHLPPLALRARLALLQAGPRQRLRVQILRDPPHLHGDLALTHSHQPTARTHPTLTALPLSLIRWDHLGPHHAAEA